MGCTALKTNKEKQVKNNHRNNINSNNNLNEQMNNNNSQNKSEENDNGIKPPRKGTNNNLFDSVEHFPHQNTDIINHEVLTKELNQELNDNQSKNGKCSKSLKTNKEFCLDNITNYYKIGNVIGTGGFGQVRICKKKEDESEKLYALKSIFRKKIIKDIINEIEILISLDHPNIIKFYEYYIDNEYFHIVTELCEGGELIEKITQRGHLPEFTVTNIIFKVLTAVSYCHSKGIVHRDLKPENIMFETNENNETEIKIIDFNLSKKHTMVKKKNRNEKKITAPKRKENSNDSIDKANYDDDTNSHDVSFNTHQNDNTMKSVIGTPFYMAPEVIIGSYNEKCDVWSIGVITYFAISGELPFSDKKSLFNVYSKILNDDVVFENPIWESVSQNCKDFINSCLIKDKSKRISVQEALHHPWFQVTRKSLTDISGLIMKQKLQNLQNFSHKEKFKKLMIKCIVCNHLSLNETKRLRSVFCSMDTAHSGYIDVSELRASFEKANIKITEKELDDIIKNCAGKMKGKIKYTEFLMGSLDEDYYVDKEILKQAFDQLDVDKTGMITTENLRAFFVRTGESAKSLEEVADVIKEVTKGKEIISFEEVCEVFKIDEVMIKRKSAIEDKEILNNLVKLESQKINKK